ncbi:hypothetical protein EJ419_01025 [Alloscardovia theropitheci]|uniref:Uncharacterized protein n=1 Tax=Alloscardovia theropitheci TaxID=2496842 RepID=A0A4R0QRK1_9BIFI|nr:hypothetical protein [Alloscardovia theropitheci]TCD55002.1 hypothetical protein EJ419_01025 [Alloscardovia theropitheci]
MRPSSDEWHIVGFSSDPVPGNPQSVDSLSAHINGKYVTPLSELSTALQQVKSKANSSSTMLMSESGKAFIDMLGDFPQKISDLHDAMKSVSTVLDTWSEDMSTQQRVAGHALEEAIEAYNSKKALQTQLNNERDNLRSLNHRDTSGYSDQQKSDLESSRSLVESQIAGLNSRISGYDSTIETAKTTIARAKSDYDQAALTAAKGIQTAQQQGNITKLSLMEKIKKGAYDFFHSKGWKKFVQIVEFVGAVVGILSIFIPGPGWLFAAITLAASAVTLVDSSAKYLSGEMSLAEFGFNLLISTLGAWSGLAGIKAVGEAKSAAEAVKIGKHSAQASKAKALFAKAAGFGEHVGVKEGKYFIAKDAISHEIGSNVIKSMMPNIVKGDALADDASKGLKLVFKDAFKTAKDTKATLNFAKNSVSTVKDAYKAYTNPAPSNDAAGTISKTFSAVQVVAPGLTGDVGKIAKLISKTSNLFE